MRNSRQTGFTLIEVIVALAIVASSLILLVAANQQSLRRTLRASEQLKLNRLMESKLDEISAGLELGRQGTFEDLPGIRWHLTRSHEENQPLKGMGRLTLSATSENSIEPLQVLSVLRWQVPPPSAKGHSDAKP